MEIRAGRTKTWEKFEVPDEGIGCGFTEAVRGVLSHHMVIRDGKIANYHPYPPTPWNANPRDCYGTPGPYEDAVQGQPIFEENDREHFKGIDIMRTVRSFDPCLPCGVHMYLGDGKKLETVHSPTQSVTGELSRGRPRTRPATRDRRAGRRASRPCSGPARRRRRLGARRARRGAGPRRHGPLRRRARADPGDRSTTAAGSTTSCSTPSRTTTSSPACCSCTACTPTSRGPGSSGRSTGLRPYLGAQGVDVELRGRGRRRRPAPAARAPAQRVHLDRRSPTPCGRRSRRPRRTPGRWSWHVARRSTGAVADPRLALRSRLTAASPAAGGA